MNLGLHLLSAEWVAVGVLVACLIYELFGGRQNKRGSFLPALVGSFLILATVVFCRKTGTAFDGMMILDSLIMITE